MWSATQEVDSLERNYLISDSDKTYFEKIGENDIESFDKKDKQAYKDYKNYKEDKGALKKEYGISEEVYEDTIQNILMEVDTDDDFSVMHMQGDFSDED